MSNPDFSGSYPPEPAEPGRGGGSRDGQRGERYGDGRHGRSTRDAGERGYRQGRDHEWDRGGADQGGTERGWADRGGPDQDRAPRGSRRAAKGRRGAAAADGMSAKDRLAAKLGTGHAMAGYPGPDDPGGSGSRDFGPRSGRRRGGPAEMHDRGGRGGNGRNGGNGGGNGRGGGSGRPRRKGDWWRHWTWKKALATFLLTGGGFVVLALIGIYYAYSQTPIPAASEFATGQASRVYFRDGSTLVGMFGQTDRQSLQPNQIPAMVRDAMVASEDKHFYNEGGVSPTGILRAAFTDLTSGSVQQGGSTITQQLVRNYYDGIGTAQTFTRKIKEIFVAEKLASAKSKAWILTNYMNTVPTGLNMYGFGAASEAYFGKPVGKLSVAQAAMIAAMPQSPSYYNPDPKAGAAYQALVFRWHYVLRTMVQMGALTQAQANAQKFPTLAKAFNNSWSGYRGYIMTAVLNELENTYHYTQAQIDDGGLHIITTFSKPMMNQLYATVNSEKRQMKLDGKALPSYAHVGAVLEQPSSGEIWAMYSGPNYNAKNCNVIRCQWDMALQNREQVGSSMKPYVLALARHQGMSVKTSTLDGYSPLWIPPVTSPKTYASRTKPANSGSWYQVGNDAGDAQANGVSVVKASAESLNTAYTDLYHRVAGTDGQNMITMAKAFGVNTTASGLYTQRSEVGTALGQASLTVEEQASTFATLANNGMYEAPHVIREIQQQLPGQALQTIQAKVATHQVLTPAENSDVDYALSFDDKPGGTAPNVGLADGREIIAKTGTTNLSQSAFFIGAIPQFSLAIGMFTNEQGCPASIAGCTAAANQESAPPAGLQTLYGVGNLPGYGGEWPATIWHAYAQKMFGPTPVQRFPTPAFGGTAWNMLGPYTPKPKPVVTPTPAPSATCKGIYFAGHCFHGRGHNPSPTPTPIPTASFPSPTPTPSKQRSIG
ncbi:MAG TPA: transglycosylase domain-containing protein [Streptosporangiaceae bacterium]